MASNNWTFRRVASWIIAVWAVPIAYALSLVFGERIFTGRLRELGDKLGAVMYGEK